MARNELDNEIRSRIDAFLHEISLLVRQSALESVHAALTGDAAPATRARAPRGRPRKAAGRVRRSGADLEQISATLVTHVKANPGQRLEEIGRALSMDTSILKRPIAKLVAGRQLKTQGQRRGMKYFAGGGRKTKAHRKATRKAGKRRGKKAA